VALGVIVAKKTLVLKRERRGNALGEKKNGTRQSDHWPRSGLI